MRCHYGGPNRAQQALRTTLRKKWHALVRCHYGGITERSRRYAQRFGRNGMLWCGATLAAAKVRHFFSALRLVPDSLYNFDRLATALAEASSAATTTARLLLLHHALLRGLVQHPLQRPMRLTRGLSARPVWYTSAGDSVPCSMKWSRVSAPWRAVTALRRRCIAVKADSDVIE